jgi:hypothetical protein
MEHLNRNGLKDGRIPEGKACPFIKECGFYDKNRCPSPSNLKNESFDCPTAKGLSLLKLRSNRKAA